MHISSTLSPHYTQGTLMSLDSKKKVTIRCMENGLLTYEMLKEISQAKKVREDELKVINQDISHINASKNLSIVRDENYEWNVNHHQSVESKAQQYKSEWGPHGLPDDVIKDLEVVEVGGGSKATARKWRKRSKKANERLKKLKPSQREYITASEDEGGSIVSDEAREFYVKPPTCERRGKDKRPIAYLRTSKQDDKELNSTDFIECNGEYLPIDQLAWVYADIKLRGYTGRIRIIVDNGVYKSNVCNKGMSLALDSVQDSDFGAVFMTTPNRAFEDAVAFQMFLQAEQIYPGLKIYCSQDTGKCRMEGARKVAERNIRRQVVIDEYNTTVSGVDQRLVRTLPEPHRQLHNRMKRAASKNLTLPFLTDISLIQTTKHGSASPWITETLRLMKNRKLGIRQPKKKGKKRKAVQPPSTNKKHRQTVVPLGSAYRKVVEKRRLAAKDKSDGQISNRKRLAEKAPLVHSAPPPGHPQYRPPSDGQTSSPRKRQKSEQQLLAQAPNQPVQQPAQTLQHVEQASHAKDKEPTIEEGAASGCNKCIAERDTGEKVCGTRHDNGCPRQGLHKKKKQKSTSRHIANNNTSPSDSNITIGSTHNSNGMSQNSNGISSMGSSLVSLQLHQLQQQNHVLQLQIQSLQCKMANKLDQERSSQLALQKSYSKTEDVQERQQRKQQKRKPTIAKATPEMDESMLKEKWKGKWEDAKNELVKLREDLNAEEDEEKKNELKTRIEEAVKVYLHYFELMAKMGISIT